MSRESPPDTAAGLFPFSVLPSGIRSNRGILIACDESGVVKTYNFQIE